jgi:hypothetical protein
MASSWKSQMASSWKTEYVDCHLNSRLTPPQLAERVEVLEAKDEIRKLMAAYVRGRHTSALATSTRVTSLGTSQLGESLFSRARPTALGRVPDSRTGEESRSPAVRNRRKGPP